MNNTIDITSQRLLNWVNSIREDNGAQYDELIDFYISSAHPSIPEGKAVIVYSGYSAEQGADDQHRQFVYLDDFYHHVMS